MFLPKVGWLGEPALTLGGRTGCLEEGQSATLRSGIGQGWMSCILGKTSNQARWFFAAIGAGERWRR